MCARVCLFICINILRAAAKASVFYTPFLCELWRLHFQFKYLFPECVFTMRSAHTSRSVFVSVLYFQPLPPPHIPSQCPALPQPHGDALGSGNMGRGTQGGRTPQLERNSNEPAQSH